MSVKEQLLSVIYYLPLFFNLKILFQLKLNLLVFSLKLI